MRSRRGAAAPMPRGNAASMARRGLLAAPLLLAAPAFAQAFPARPIRMVVGFPAGGGVDTLARPIMQRLGDRLGQAVVIENRAGNNGNIAMDYVAKSAPDGYTLFIGNVGNLAITHALFPNLPFDTTRDFAGVAQTTLGPCRPISRRAHWASWWRWHARGPAR
jgi:tripartite-type tricarboxylate transporter receptor subunit TctC